MKTLSRRGLLKITAALAALPSLTRGTAALQRTTTQDRGTLLPAAREAVNPSRHLLLRRGTVITMDRAVGDFVEADVHIQGKHIVAVARNAKVPAGTRVIDARGTIVIPGFV